MTNDLARRIEAVARRSRAAQQQAEAAFDRAVEARRPVLGKLLDAAAAIVEAQGATLGGHPFCFLGPDARPTYDPHLGVFVGRVLEASFDGCPGNSTFGLSLEIDHYQQVTSCYSGAAALEDTRDVVGIFVAWLDEMWLCYPMKEAMTVSAEPVPAPADADP